MICLGPHAGEILTKLYGPNYREFWAFWHKMVNRFWQSVDAIMEDVSVTETIVNLKPSSFSGPKFTLVWHDSG